MAGSGGNSVFSVLRSRQTVFHSSCTTFCSRQHGTRAPVLPQPPQPLLFSGVLIAAILMGIKVASGGGFDLHS